ncbi:MAG: hypothetical protein M1300_09535 [Epsilonproteobacteria bacterium]|nr:hypothetical protein [Campylobacterota bacterium]MDP2194179.1 hypothetical protein [Alphaproteobacteria bacterium]OYZ58886.1 MAG: hypothetical protein B7Y17_05890 [Sulfuricurvum sp. 24-42-5]
MDALQKELESRKSEIINGVELFFKANMTITDWDVPEVDDHAAAMQLIALMQEALDKIKVDIASGKYDYY